MHCKMCKMWSPPAFLIVLNSFMVEAFPVFSFNGITSPQKSPSYAFLVEEVLLPDNFVLCSSIKQAMFDDVGFYTINGNDSQEWLGMEFRTSSTETKLTVRRGQNIHSFGKLMSPRLDYWYHICMRSDLNGNEIEVAVNGRLLGRVAELGSLSSGHGHGNFRQAHIYNFRDKCVVIARNRNFATLTH